MQLLAHLVRCPELHRDLQSFVEQTDFDWTVHRAIFAAARDCRSSHEFGTSANCEVPKGLVVRRLVNMVRQGVIRNEEVDDVDLEVRKLYEEDVRYAPYFKEEMAGFLKNQRVRRAANDHLAHVQAGEDFNPEAFVESISAQYATVATGPQIRSVEPLQDINSLLPHISVDVIPTGFSTIDEKTGGGLPKKKTALLCAYTGIGKTTMAINLMHNAAMRGHHARMVTLELPKEEVALRYYSMVSGYDYMILQKGDPTGRKSREVINWELKQALMRRIEANPRLVDAMRRFRIWDLHDETCDVNMLRRKIQEERTAGMQIDTIAIDWLDIMGLPPESRSERQVSEHRHMLEHIARDLDTMHQTENIAGWVTTQANDEAYDKARVTMKANSEARGKSKPMSWFVGLGASKRDREEGIFTWTIDKNRDGPTFAQKLKGHLHVQRFDEFSEEDEVAAIHGNNRAQPAQPAAAAQQQAAADVATNPQEMVPTFQPPPGGPQG